MIGEKTNPELESDVELRTSDYKEFLKNVQEINIRGDRSKRATICTLQTGRDAVRGHAGWQIGNDQGELCAPAACEPGAGRPWSAHQ